MAISSFPFDSQTSTESDWSHLFRYLSALPGGGVVGAPDTTGLKVTGDSSGMNVKVAAGTGIVRGHMVITDAVTTVTITAASSSNPRIDSIVAELDPTANAITLKAIAGTAAASPVAPTLTQTDTGVYQLQLATVLVAQSVTSIAPAAVTDTRPFFGSEVGVWTTANRPAASTGLTGINTTLGQPEFAIGSTWYQVALQGASITASQLSATEQAKVAAGTVRTGGASGGTEIVTWQGSATPTPTAGKFNVWYVTA